VRRRVVKFKPLLAMALLLAAGTTQAAPIAVPDPKAWVALSPMQQQQKREEIRRQLETATASEREAFRRDLRVTLQGMSPQDRRVLIDRTKDRWLAMTPLEREAFKRDRAKRLEQLPADERMRLLAERRAMLERLSPDERAALREKLPGR